MTEFWGSEELAAELGVSARRARQISRSYASFPIPEVSRKGVRLWRAEVVRRWIELHGGRSAGRPAKVDGLRRIRLSQALRDVMTRRQVSADFVADRLDVPVPYVETIANGTTPDREWPSPTLLRELSYAVGQHPAILFDAAGYMDEARRERANSGRDNSRTQALADATSLETRRVTR